MLLLTCLASLLMGQTGDAQRPTLVQQVVTRHDPNNGYEDYVRAADVVRGTEIDAYFDWRPGQYPRMPAVKGDPVAATIPDFPDYLAAMRKVVEKFGPALDLIREGNRKRAYDPRVELNGKTTYPEVREFTRLGKLIRADAYVRFADGDSKGAVGDLLDGLTFARHIAVSAMIGELVSLLCESYMFGAFDEHIPQLSDKDALAVEHFVDSAIDEPEPFVKILANARDVHIKMVADLLASKDAIKSLAGENKALSDYLSGASQPEERDVLDGFTTAANACYGQMIAQLLGDESTWTEPVDFGAGLSRPSLVTMPQDAVAMMLYEIQLASMVRYFSLILTRRTQLRLLRLSAKIVEFRWHRNRLPANLAEAAPAALVYDPVAKAPFQYEITGETYRIYSKGTKATGQIELKSDWLNPAPPSDDGAVPPP